jgi:S-adenosylmethionine-dependent methyltransferase
MHDDISEIRDFYNREAEREHWRLERHPIERDVTWSYLHAYLPPRGLILDVGAATGAYTIPLAKLGYYVTAVDFSESLLDMCLNRAREEGIDSRIACIAADARDLSIITRNDYDAALIMGPLYHLVVEADRQAAVKEVYDRLKPGGIIVSAFISRFGIWADIMNKNPEILDDPAGAQMILDEGQDPVFTEWGRTFRAYFARLSEIAPLHERTGFRTLTVAGAEPLGIGMNETYADLSETSRRNWLDLMLKISAEPSILGASTHILYIGRKPA